MLAVRVVVAVAQRFSHAQESIYYNPVHGPIKGGLTWLPTGYKGMYTVRASTDMQQFKLAVRVVVAVAQRFSPGEPLAI